MNTRIKYKDGPIDEFELIDDFLPSLLLLHSPLVPGMTMQPLAQALENLGYESLTPDLSTPDASIANHHAHQAAQIESVLSGWTNRETIVVAHSGAGTLLSTLNPNGISACIMLDAIFMDRPGCRLDFFDDQAVSKAWREVAERHNGYIPASMVARFAEHIRDPAQRSRFEADVTDVPIAVYTEHIPRHVAWPPKMPALYLQWTPTYADDAARAALAGFTVIDQPASHFELMNNPYGVARQIRDFLDGSFQG